jgi:hypothetical protein
MGDETLLVLETTSLYRGFYWWIGLEVMTLLQILREEGLI